MFAAEEAAFDEELDAHREGVRRDIEDNDPCLLSLDIDCGVSDLSTAPYWPSDWDWEGDGRRIGRNARLEKLILSAVDYVPMEDLEVFVHGMSSNTSIKSLLLRNYQRTPSLDTYNHGGRLFPMLVPFFRSARLESLSIDDSGLGSGISELLASALAAFSTLKSFSISDTGEGVYHLASGAGIIRSLQTHPDLESIDFYRTELGRDGCVALATLLGNPSCNLRKLRLPFSLEVPCPADDRAEILAPGLARLKEIVIDTLDLTCRGWRAIFSAFTSPRCELEVLDVRWCNISKDAVSSLAEVVNNNPHLKSLRMPNVRMEGAWGPLLSALSSPECRLEEVDLNNVERGYDFAPFAKALSRNNHLRRLNLSQNRHFTNHVWQALFSAVQSKQSLLQELNLFNASLSDGTLNIIRNALVNGTNLKALDLGWNGRVTTAGWLHFLEALQSPNCTLEVLSLHGSGNGINNEVVGFLTNISSGNSVLRELRLCENRHVTSNAWGAFFGVLRNRGTALEKLGLEFNIIDGDAILALSNALSDNATLLEINIARVSMTSNGWGALTHALCNRSSIMSTYSSNHSLGCVQWYGEGAWPKDLKALLRLNRKNSKSQAARLKIIDCHFRDGFLTTPFVGLELPALPFALEWMVRSGSGGDVNWRAYEFLRGMPALFCSNDKGAKRKRE